MTRTMCWERCTRTSVLLAVIKSIKMLWVALCALRYLLLISKNKASVAERIFRRVIKIAPNNTRAYLNQKIYSTSKRMSLEQKQRIAQRLTLILWPMMHDNLAMQLKDKDDISGAVYAFRKVTVIKPSDARAWSHLGDLLQWPTGDISGAEHAHHKVTVIDPCCSTAWFHLGKLLQTVKKKISGAVKAYRRAIDLNPSHAMTWNHLGMVLAHRYSNIPEAEAAFRNAIAVDKSCMCAWLHLGHLLLDAN